MWRWIVHIHAENEERCAEGPIYGSYEALRYALHQLQLFSDFQMISVSGECLSDPQITIACICYTNERRLIFICQIVYTLLK